MTKFKRIIFDLESDGLLDDMTTIHSLVVRCVETGETLSASSQLPGSIQTALDVLAEADAVIGHNVINFDLPAIKKLYPKWEPRGVVRDTIILARLFVPKDRLFEQDVRAKKIPTKLFGAFSLEAWGYRLGEYKGDFKGPWDQWSQTMQDYCEQDVVVTAKLFEKMLETASEWGLDMWDPVPPAGKDAIQLEHDVARIVSRQERYGFAFDRKAATSLYGTLVTRKLELAEALQLEFPPKVITSTFTPKRPNKKLGYQTGVPIERSITVPFNPGSRKQIAERLVAMGWHPEEYTADGTPKLDDEVISALTYPAAKVLGEYLTVEKRLGQLSTGKQALMLVERKGRIHGRVTTNGAVTGRMTHSNPNMAQVPTCTAPYGKDFRKLLTNALGTLVGCDADALEMRCLAHFMAPYDDGAYAQTVDQGSKAEGTDPHTVNCLALGLEPKTDYGNGMGTGRDITKTWFYAFIYGAGDWKLGNTRTGQKTPKQRVANIGKQDRAKFLAGLPALKSLTGAIRRTLEGYKGPDGKSVGGRDWLRGIDGRRIYVRSAHSALNTLLQSAGALVMKRALVRLDDSLAVEHFLVPGKDFEFVANVHDEWQIDCRKAEAELVGSVAACSIEWAGKFYGFRCPLKGNFDIGETWADTH